MRKRISNEDPEFISLTQPALFDFTETSSGSVELFPAVWSALEDLTSPEARIRLSGLERLQVLNAPRLSPLVAYLLATRLVDPDLTVRMNVLKILGDALASDRLGRPIPEGVTRHVVAYLSEMSDSAITSLLETVATAPELEPYSARLLNYCPSAGTYLADLLLDRKKSLMLRKQAVRMIGLVGFLDAVPALERLEGRLIARLNGQQLMPFASPTVDESDLLPEVQKAIARLKYS